MPGLAVRVYECFVTGVRPLDRVIDAKSRGGVDFRNVSYLLPYINLLGGGIDCVPQSGDRCLILSSDVDPNNVHRSRFTFCIGFALPVTPTAGGLELGGRITDLPPGSTAISAVGEDGSDARVICYQGGTVFLGSGLSASTLYSPIDKSITHVFDNWQMFGPGGQVTWSRESGESAVRYEAEYRVDAEDEEATKVNVKIGSDESLPLEISVSQGALDPPPLRISVNSNGEAFIEAQSLSIFGDKTVDIDGGQVVIKGKQVLSESDPL